MDNEIEDTINEFERWIELLDEDPTPSAQFEFSEFCYVNLPKVIKALKQAQQEQAANLAANMLAMIPPGD